MEIQTVNINLDALQLIQRAVSSLQQCGGISNDDDLWRFADCCTASANEPAFPKPFTWSQAPMQSVLAELERAQALKGALYALAQSCERRLQSLKAELRPAIFCHGVESLPDEVLADIFQLVADECQDDETGPFCEAVLPEWSLSQVCTRFRTVALGTPLLWSRTSSLMTKACVRCNLARSKSAPLTVIVVAFEWSKHLKDYLQLVTPHASRWRSFTFEIADVDYIQPAFPAKINKCFRSLQLPSLKDLKLYLRSVGDASGKQDFDFYSTWTIPNVLHVDISEVTLPTSAEFLSVGAITSLKFVDGYGPCDMQGLLDMLVSMPNLLKLCLWINADLEQDPVHVRPGQYLLPKLAELSVYSDSPSVFSAVMCLKTPVLRKLALCLDCATGDQLLGDFLRGLPKQACLSVRDLDFTISGQEPFDMRCLFSTFPGLERLKLDVPNFYYHRGHNELPRTMPPLRSCSISLRTAPFTSRWRGIVDALKSDGKWDNFEFLQFDSDGACAKRGAERLLGDKLVWHESCPKMIRMW